MLHVEASHLKISTCTFPLSLLENLDIGELSFTRLPREMARVLRRFAYLSLSFF